MVSFGSRRGAAGAGAMPLMVLAFLSAGGFMAWLFVRAAPVEVEVVEGGAVVDEGVAARIPLDEFGTNPMAHADLLLELRGLLVQSRIGTQAFFVQVPNQGGPYLVKMLSDDVMDGEAVEPESTITVTGRVHAMLNADSVADAWVASGAIGEGDRILVLVSEGGSFFEAERVTVTGQPQPEDN